MKICYFGTFDKNYQRNRIIRKGLQKNGVEIVLCHSEYTGFFFTYLKLFLRWLLLPKKEIVAIIVGEANFVIVPLAKVIGILWNKPVLLDAFFSMYQTMVFDRKIVKENSWSAKRLHLIDKIGCLLADVVILDTSSHIDYFRREYNLEKKNIIRVFVGADDSIFFPKEPQQISGKLTVLFWGSYIPLHGTKYIIEAAWLLKERKDILFKLVGEGQMYRETFALAESLKLDNVEFLPAVAEEELTKIISSADICLGIFGDTQKARQVVPHKVFQAMAMKKPVITAKTPATEEILEDRKTVFYVRPGSPQDLSSAITTLKDDPALRTRLAENAYNLYKQRFIPEVIVSPILEIIKTYE